MHYVSDFTVLVIGVSGALCQCVVLLFARETWLVEISCVLGGFVAIVYPCFTSMTTSAVPANELGKLQGAIGVLKSLGMGVGSLVFGPLLGALHEWPNGIWLVCSILALAAFLCVVSLHRHLPPSQVVNQHRTD